MYFINFFNKLNNFENFECIMFMKLKNYFYFVMNFLDYFCFKNMVKEFIIKFICMLWYIVYVRFIGNKDCVYLD